MLNTQRVRVLIIGSGGRESGLYWKLSQSIQAKAVFVMPGNAGIIDAQRVIGVDVKTFSDVRDVIHALNINLVVVGPEQPLVDGLGDYLAEMAPEVAFFGPSKKAAQLEGSKAFCKQLCTKYGIPTAGYEVVTLVADAQAVIGKWGAPIVIKASGLAAGKGVTMAMTVEDAYKAVDNLHASKPGEDIVIEEMLVGGECSAMVLCDGDTFEMLALARDYKRLRSGPEGPDNPNTGGMGAYSPLPDVSDAMKSRIRTEIIAPLVAAMKAEGTPYKGVLYAGIMITEHGPMLLEVNCRFGDPETQTILPRLESDLLPHLLAVTNGTLGKMEPLLWSTQRSVCINMVSGGYPGKPKTGYRIEGLQEASKLFNVQVFHAGTETIAGGEVITAGGRVVSVVGMGEDWASAMCKAYRGVDEINWLNEYHRTDIGS